MEINEYMQTNVFISLPNQNKFKCVVNIYSLLCDCFPDFTASIISKFFSKVNNLRLEAISRTIHYSAQ